MEKEEKELLKKALCYYLPFELKGQMENNEGYPAIYKLEGIKWGYVYVSETNKIWGYTEERPMERFKPYLRPITSMSESEYKVYNSFSIYGMAGVITINNSINTIHCRSFEEMDYLIAHHFDYMGLIEKGLALKAPEGMYK